MSNFTFQDVINASVLRVKPQKVAMENIQATHLLQLVHLDYLMIRVTKGGKDVHMLVILDHFMRYIQALITSLQTAKCTVQALWYRFVVYWLTRKHNL